MNPLLGLTINLLACSSSTRNTSDFTTAVGEPSIVVEPSDTGVPEEPSQPSDDTSDPVNINTMLFRTVDLSCAELNAHTMTFTRMIPGGLSVSGDVTASFFEEAFRVPLSSISTTSIENLDGTTDCEFSVALPEPSAEEFTPITVSNSDGTTSELDIQWVFYFPATFVAETFTCLLSNSVINSTDERVQCELSYSVGSTGEPDAETLDPSLSGGDFYDWGSEVVPVYLSGNITGSFADLGFEAGWNLTQIVDGELQVIEAMAQLDQLATTYIDNSSYLPRYSINGKGTESLNTDFGTMNSYTIGLRPLKWLLGINQSEPVSFMYLQDSSNSWTIEAWGRPETADFIDKSYDPLDTEYTSYSEQWDEYVRVAPFVPSVFSGSPTSYSDGAPTLGDELSFTDTGLGSMCKDSSSLVFLFLDPPRRPSEMLWVMMSDRHPGWWTKIGTQNQSSTWRYAAENTNLTEPYDYLDLSTGGSCTLHPDWEG